MSDFFTIEPGANGAFNVVANGGIIAEARNELMADWIVRCMSSAPDMLAALKEARKALLRICDLGENGTVGEARFIAREAMDFFHEKPLVAVGNDACIAMAEGRA